MSSCPHVILEVIADLGPQAMTNQISQASAHMQIWMIQIPNQPHIEQACILFPLKPSSQDRVGGGVVCQIDGACTGVEKVEGLWCLSLPLGPSECLRRA